MLVEETSLWTTAGEIGAWVIYQSSGDSCLEEIFTGEYSNILWGPENETLYVDNFLACYRC